MDGDMDMKENLDQILLMYEVGIECEINKTMATFEAMTPIMNPKFASCFFDILKNRMTESLRKCQMLYLAAMEKATEKSNDTDADGSSEVIISVSTEDLVTVSANASIEVDTPAIAIKMQTPSAEVNSSAAGVTLVGEPAQTMKECIDAAIAEILSDTNDEMPENEQSENVEKVNNEAVVETASNEPTKYVKEDTTETNEFVSNSENLDEPNSRDEASESDSMAVTPENQLAKAENEHISKPTLNEISSDFFCLSEEERISDCSQVDSVNNTKGLPFLGFNDSIPVQAAVNLLKRKEIEALKINEEKSKKRKISRQMKDDGVKKGKDDIPEGEKEESCDKSSEEEEGVGSEEAVDQQEMNLSCSIDREPELDQPDAVRDTIDQCVQPQIDFHSNEIIARIPVEGFVAQNYSTVDTSNVLVSRLSMEMVPRMLHQIDCSIHKDGVINAFCYLCEKTLTAMTYVSWREHVLKHTNEMPFYCMACRMLQPAKVAHGNCSIDKVTDIFEAHAASHAVKAYMCKWCNYVQVHKTGMTAHLTEHEQNELDPNRNRNIQSVTLLPDLEPLTWTITGTLNASVDLKFVPESKRFVCNIEGCGIEYVNGNEFKNHFQQNHSTQTAFKCPHCGKMIEKKNRQLFIEICTHFQMHSGHLYKCSLCQIITGYEYDMMQHMARHHYTEKQSKHLWAAGHGQYDGVKLKYWYSHGQGDVEFEKQECTIWFQCNVCDARFEYANDANDHFIKAHKSYYINFGAVKMVKRTTVDGVTSCFVAAEKKKYTFRRSLICKLCNQMQRTRSALIEHFNRDHPMHEIAVRLGNAYVNEVSWNSMYKELSAQNITFDNHMVYYCAICRDFNQPTSSLAFVNVADVHAHWMVAHAPNLRPFQFYAIEFVSCFHCDHIASFYEVKRHHYEAHPQKTLIVTNVLDSKQCALCDYIGHNLAQHTTTKHELVLRSTENNPNRFSDDTLDKLLAIDIHKKHKCGYCAKVCETAGEIKRHISHDHRLQIKFQTFSDSHSVKCITGCCESIVDLHEFLNHLADPNHKFPSSCSKCNFETDEMLDFVDHQVNVHRITKNADGLYRRLLQTRFWKTLVVFGNGLVLNKHNLIGTEFDDSKPFEALVEQLLNVARQRINARLYLHGEYDE